MDWNSVLPYVPYALLGLFCLLAGYAWGARRARAVRRRVLRDLNAQSLELLDTRSSLQTLEHYAAQHERKDRLLQLTLKRLQQSETLSRQLSMTVSQQKKKHFVETSRLRLDAVEAREEATRATEIARRATAQLHRLEQATAADQTIIAPEPKSCDKGEAVTVSVFDPARLEAVGDNKVPVSNRDSARLTTLQTSNEANAPLV